MERSLLPGLWHELCHDARHTLDKFICKSRETRGSKKNTWSMGVFGSLLLVSLLGLVGCPSPPGPITHGVGQTDHLAISHTILTSLQELDEVIV